MNDHELLFNYLLDQYHVAMMKEASLKNIDEATKLLSMIKAVFRMALRERIKKDNGEWDD